MNLNGCSRKLCPMQVGCTDYCRLTKEQCPYYTQDIDVQKALNLIKAELVREIFEEITKSVASKLPITIRPIFKDDRDFEEGYRCGKYDGLIEVLALIAELKEKYTEGERSNE